MQKPELSEQDVLYVYKEQWFTGFAPCFSENTYSLACCKGNKKNGGMRVSICKTAKLNNNNVWILSVAGNEIRLKDHNESGVNYAPGDMICLVKVDPKKLLCWQDYYTKYHDKRCDAIYSYDEAEKCMIWHPNKNEDHKGAEYLSTDCAVGIKNFHKMKQIIMSNEFYIFSEGNPVPKELNVGHGYSYKNINPVVVKDYINDNPHCIKPIGIDPFTACNNNYKGCK